MYDFLFNAVIVSVLASVAAGIIGSFIVVKRMSIISGSIAHTAFGGLGIAYYLQINPLIGATLFSILSSFAITYVRKNARDKLDTLLSTIWSLGMAIGLLFIFMSPGYASNLFSYLFGNILLVSNTDLIFILILDIIVVATVILLFNSFKAITFDEEFSRVRNLPVNLLYLILFTLIALTVVTEIRIVGIILMIALLSIPAATAQLYCRRLKDMMIAASVISFISINLGLLISYLFDLPTGPIIILVITLIYITAMWRRKNAKK